MEVYLFKDGQRFGPYSTDQVKEYLASGDFAETDLAYFEGRDGWVPITKVPGVVSQDDDFDDPEVDYDRQRELADMFPDPDEDLDDAEEESEDEAPLPEASASPSSSQAEPQHEAEAVVDQAVEPQTAQDSPQQPASSGNGGGGRRFSLSKAQAARRGRGGKGKGQRRGGIPLPRRPGIAAFGWLIFFSLLYGIGVSMMPAAGVERSSSAFVRISGNLHPLLVHLPVAALLLAFPMHLVDRPGLFRHVGSGSVFVLWVGMLGSLLAVFTGYFQSFAGVSDVALLNDHETWGILVGSGACGSLFLKLLSRRFGEAWLHHLCSAFLFATVVTLFYNLHTGVSLTHGNDYLGLDSGSGPVEEPSPPEPPAAEENQEQKEEENKEEDEEEEPEVIEENPF